LLDELDKAFMAAGYQKEAAVISRSDFAKKCWGDYFNPETCQFFSDVLLQWDGIGYGEIQVPA
jgi:hypothetical protein